MQTITSRYQNVLLIINQQEILILLSLFLLRTSIHKKMVFQKVIYFLNFLKVYKKKKKTRTFIKVKLMIVNATHSLFLRGII